MPGLAATPGGAPRRVYTVCDTPATVGGRGPDVGVRELRAGLAAPVRRAGAGERIVVTVDGGRSPSSARSSRSAGDATLDDLVAAACSSRARRRDRPAPDVRVDLGRHPPRPALAEVRGGDAGPRRRVGRGTVTLALDTTALLARYLSGPHRGRRRSTRWPPTPTGARRPSP